MITMKCSAVDLRAAINDLREAAGLRRQHLYGTSLSTLQLSLNMAERGQFSPDKPLSNSEPIKEICDKLGISQMIEDDMMVEFYGDR